MKLVVKVVTGLIALLMNREAVAQLPQLCERLIRLVCQSFPPAERSRFVREYLGDLERTEGVELAKLLTTLRICFWAAPRAADVRTGGTSSLWLAATTAAYAGGFMTITSAVYAVLMKLGAFDTMTSALAVAAGLSYLVLVVSLSIFFVCAGRVDLSDFGHPMGGRCVRLVRPAIVVFYTLMTVFLAVSLVQDHLFMSTVIHQYLYNLPETLIRPFENSTVVGMIFSWLWVSVMVLSGVVYVYVTRTIRKTTVDPVRPRRS